MCPPVPDLETNKVPPESAEISLKETEVENDQTWAVESTYRSQYIYPSNWGQAGIFRVRSAEGLPPGTLTFGIGGEFYAVTDAPDLGFGNTTARTIAESLFLGYSPVDNLTLAVMRRNSSTTFGNPQTLISSLGDMNFSALYSFPLSPRLAIGPLVDVLIASNFNDLAPAGNTVSIGGGFALSYSFYQALNVPLFAHANLIYHVPQIRTDGPDRVAPETFFNFSRYHTVTFGLGLEYKLGDFIPFLEYQESVHANSGVSFGRSPSKISVGTRITPLSNKSLAFLLGTDIGVSRGLAAGIPFTPGFQILGQLSYTVALTTTERKHYYTTQDINIVDRKFIIKKNINFKVASAELENDSKRLLDQIARVIKENRINKLLIVGHTDSTFTEEYNLKLSIDRANSVKRYLIGQGISADKLLAQGFGKRKPKASNLSEKGRSLNRRVEFFILE